MRRLAFDALRRSRLAFVREVDHIALALRRGLALADLLLNRELFRQRHFSLIAVSLAQRGLRGPHVSTRATTDKSASTRCPLEQVQETSLPSATTTMTRSCPRFSRRSRMVEEI